MKKIFESGWVAQGETADKIHVFQFESEDEFWEFEAMNHIGRCDYFGVFDQALYEVAPGALYYTYRFDSNISFVIMYETQGFNV